MSSTGLSIPVALVAPATTVAPALPAVTQPLAADFMVMIQQLLGSAQAPPPAVSTQLTPQPVQCSVVSEDELEEVESNECAGLAALLALLPPASSSGGGGGGVPAGEISGDITPEISPTGAKVAVAPESAVTESADLLLTELTSSEAVADAATDVDVAPFTPTSSEASTASRPTPQLDAALSRPVQPHVGSTAWSDEIAARLTLMTEHGKHSASLRLSPEHLGPLEVRIAVNDDQASVWFGAAHADTRAAIEQALPRLRELFEAQGLSLADAGVFREPPREQPQSNAGSPATDDKPPAEENVTIAKARLGLVDAYA